MGGTFEAFLDIFEFSQEFIRILGNIRKVLPITLGEGGIDERSTSSL